MLLVPSKFNLRRTIIILFSLVLNSYGGEQKIHFVPSKIHFQGSSQHGMKNSSNLDMMQSNLFLKGNYLVDAVTIKLVCFLRGIKEHTMY